MVPRQRQPVTVRNAQNCYVISNLTRRLGPATGEEKGGPFRGSARGNVQGIRINTQSPFVTQRRPPSQRPTAIVLEDGERIRGCIDWYDRNSIKVRGRSKTLIYKSPIKYMCNLGDSG